MAGDVFVTKEGKKYHEQTCSLIKNKSTTTLEENEAVEKGLKPCTRCFKDKAKEDKAVKKEKKDKLDKSQDKKAKTDK